MRSEERRAAGLKVESSEVVWGGERVAVGWDAGGEVGYFFYYLGVECRLCKQVFVLVVMQWRGGRSWDVRDRGRGV